MVSPTEEIKSRLDLVEFIQSYLVVHKAGINYKANCPFHSEKTPSFFVSPGRQIWHCFGCGKGGDIFKFVMEIEGHDFPEALRLLAARAGVVLKREDPAISSERNRLYDICEEAVRVFERSLSLTPAAKVYLKKRGLREETIREFRIGFAPQNWNFLLKALAEKKFRPEEVEKAGLAVRSEDRSSWYDRFRSRIMFPVSDVNGRVVGFGGRIFEPDAGGRDPAVVEAKYVNTPATLVYDKSRVLYGLDKAKQEVRTKNQVVVVEGYMDCVMSYQAGVQNVIAVSGTALTPYQLKTLRRLCDTLVSSFDTDAAGESATKRSLALAAEFEFNRRIVAIPSGKDPADTVLESPERWQKAVEEAKPVVEFYFAKTFQEINPATAEGKKKISSTLLPLIAELANEIERAHWVGELSGRLGVAEEAIWKELRRKPGESTSSRPAQEVVKEFPVSRRVMLEERLLALLAVVGSEVGNEIVGNCRFAFASSFHEEIFRSVLARPQAVTLAGALKEQYDLLRFKGEVLAGMSRDIREELRVCGRELEKEGIREELQRLGQEISRLEQEGGVAAVASLLEDFRSLSERLKTLSTV